VRLEDPRDLRRIAAHLKRNPILGPETGGEQPKRLRRRIDATG
jgi:hypothetical protein